jgi:hypothetical protein
MLENAVIIACVILLVLGFRDLIKDIKKMDDWDDEG